VAGIYRELVSCETLPDTELTRRRRGEKRGSATPALRVDTRPSPRATGLWTALTLLSPDLLIEIPHLSAVGWLDHPPPVEFSRRSDRAVLTSIALTAADYFGGPSPTRCFRGGAFLARKLWRKVLQPAVIAAMTATAEIAPTALGVSCPGRGSPSRSRGRPAP
jgi:hypothetical protein